MKRFLPPALALVVALAPLAGCGNDSNTRPATPTTVNLRNGTWEVRTSRSWSGPGDCSQRPDTVGTVIDTLALCEFNLISESGGSGLGCDITLDGDDVVFDCSRSLERLDPCELVRHLTGSGTVSDTAFTFLADREDVLSGPGDPCDLYRASVDSCILHLEITGTFIDTTGAWACPEDAPAAPGVLRSLILRAADGGRAGS